MQNGKLWKRFDAEFLGKKNQIYLVIILNNVHVIYNILLNNKVILDN